MRFCVLLLIFISLVCALGAPQAAGQEIAPGFAVPGMQKISPDVYVEKLAPNLWVYTEIGKLGDGSPYPANGTLLIAGDHSVLIDTGWTAEQAETLVAFARERLKKPVKKAIVTHWHADRAGGVAVMQKYKIETIALDLTARILAQQSRPVPDHLLTRAQLPYTDPDGFEIYYPGEGHTPDNIVVYFPRQKVLDGGCFLKSANSDNLGFVGDANLKAWPQSLEDLARRYPEAKIVIPGHGSIAGDAIGVTRKLLAEDKSK